MEQNTEEWRFARCGSLGASQIADAISTGRDGKTFGATSINISANLVIERLTGRPIETYKSPAMMWGSENEENAKRAYEAHTGEFVSDVGLYTHPTIKGTHASPDGLVGVDGLVEIKCPNSATHIETLKAGKVATRYIYQMQWQMACTGRAWCDFVSFDPRMPEHLQLFVERHDRDDKLIAELEAKVGAFLQRVQNDLDAFHALGGEI